MIIVCILYTLLIKYHYRHKNWYNLAYLIKWLFYDPQINKVSFINFSYKFLTISYGNSIKDYIHATSIYRQKQ
jgi:hypothetical protein